MEEQETEMKWKNGNWKLEIEIGNGTGSKKPPTNHWCNVFFTVCLVRCLVIITLVFYLAMVIGLAL